MQLFSYSVNSKILKILIQTIECAVYVNAFVVETCLHRALARSIVPILAHKAIVGKNHPSLTLGNLPRFLYRGGEGTSFELRFLKLGRFF